MVETVAYVGLDHSHRSLYLESLAQLPVEISAVCEPDPSVDIENVAGIDTDQVAMYHDPLALLEAEPVDLIWLTLSNRQTLEVLEAALEHDVHVFAEKTLARTSDELAPLVSAAADSDATVGVSYFNRAAPRHRELRKRRQDGFFGDVRAFGASLFTNKLATRLQSDQQPNYLYDSDAMGGGIVQWLGCHYLDLVEWILGDPIERVNAQLSSTEEATGTEDGGSLQLATASGAQGTLQLGYYLRAAAGPRGDAARGPTPDPLYVYGMDGAAVVSADGASLRLGADVPAWDSAPVRTISFEQPDVSGYAGQAGLDYLTAFLELCEGNDSDLVATIEDDFRVLRLIDAIYESADTNEWVAPA